VLITTLDTVEVIVHVEEGDGDGEAGNHDTVHLAGRPRVADDDGNEDHLNNGELGDGGNRETNVDVLDLLSRLGLKGFGITRHFIIY